MLFWPYDWDASLFIKSEAPTTINPMITHPETTNQNQNATFVKDISISLNK